ncbi:hypothetical protein Tco_1335241 [Tanacetum coccineum]
MRIRVLLKIANSDYTKKTANSGVANAGNTKKNVNSGVANSGDTNKTVNSGVANSGVANSATIEVANSDIANSATTEIANSDIANSATTEIANSDIANSATTKIANSCIANMATTEIANSGIANLGNTKLPIRALRIRESIMELYMQNREHGRMIFESVEYGPLIWPMIEENGMTRTKKYEELSETKKIQADCNLKERECKVYDAFDKFAHIKVAQRRLEGKQLEDKTNTDCLVKKQEKEYHIGWKIKMGNVLDSCNQRSSSSSIGFKTPIDMLGVFGWLASIKQGMLEPVKVKCIFLGYLKGVVGNKLWRLDDVTSKVVDHF